jgi:hypothetical protein
MAIELSTEGYYYNKTTEELVLLLMCGFRRNHLLDTHWRNTLGLQVQHLKFCLQDITESRNSVTLQRRRTVLQVAKDNLASVF